MYSEDCVTSSLKMNLLYITHLYNKLVMSDIEFSDTEDIELKSCNNCKRQQPKTQFIHSRTHKQCKICANCRMVDKKCRSNPTSKRYILSQHYQKLKNSLPPCKICSDNENLHKEFNHIDPLGEKDINMKKENIVARCNSIELMDKEASKCECLCRKCHNKITQLQINSKKKNNKTTSRVQKLKRLVDDIKRQIGKCQADCNDIFDPEIPSFYEFDHINRQDKVDNISCMVRGNLPIETIKEEISKCQLLCGYCHLKKTMEEHRINYYNNVTSRIIKREIKDKKLSQEQVNEIRKIWSTDFNIQQKDLAKTYGVSRSYISGITRNVIYKSISYISITNRPKIVKSLRKLSDCDIREIRKLYSGGGIKYQDIAKVFSCSISYVGQICRNIYRKE